jgi:glutathione S-transferase
VLTLHVLPPLDRAPSLSPFCLKVMTYARMASIPHEVVVTLDATAGPKGKLPFLVDGDTRLGDSYFIVEHLRRTRDVDAALDARQRAIALAVSRMLDEHLYWAIVHSRWLDDRMRPRMVELFLGALPAEQKAAVTTMVVDGMAKTMHAHGIGRHTPDEIAARAKADLTAVSALLGDQPFGFGDEPTSIDACIYASVANLIDVDLDTELRRCALAQPNLVAHCQRMRARYFA